MSLEAKLQQASVEYQKLQADLSKAVEARQRLDAQLSENELVKKVPLVRTNGENHSDTTFQEFDQLTPENAVFKLIGPVLVKQDQAEAKSNVETRLGFIRSEMSDFFYKTSLHKRNPNGMIITVNGWRVRLRKWKKNRRKRRQR